LCFICVEDDADVQGTIAHHAVLRFAALILVGDTPGLGEIAERNGVLLVQSPIQTRDDVVGFLNAVIPSCAGRWLYWCYNAEYLFFPYSSTRSIGDLTAFMEEERRESVFTYAVDLYARDLYQHPNAISRDDAYFDRSGYYAFQRYEDGQALERQFNVFGGLAWRYEQFIPWDRRRIDRISLFRAADGLKMREDFTLSEPEMNTVACQWHHNVTAAVASYRVAKSLKRNPGSTFEIDSMLWRQSQRFDWSADQLLELGMIEPGQWF
jgi:hypothetical protein